jgi:hypothetical protein
MHRYMLHAVILAGITLAPAGGYPEAPLQFKSVSVNLPFGDKTFPPGPGSDAINGNCLACHSADMVLNQPKLSKSAWTAIVDKMIKIYKAPVASADVPAIIDYLMATKGAQ